MKNLFRKTSKGTTPKALKIKCTKETKEQVSSIMKKIWMDLERIWKLHWKRRSWIKHDKSTREQIFNG